MVTVTKREAVKALIRGAMRSAREDNMVCALTLAGAAEEAMPRAQDLTAFEMLKILCQCRQVLSGKQAADALNLERNWLKHHSLGEPITMQIDTYTTGTMLFRALSRYVIAYGFDDLYIECGELLRYLDESDST